MKQRAKAIADEEVADDERQKSGTLAFKLPELPVNFDDGWLEQARQLERATGGQMIVVNPRILQPQTLMDVDMEWLNDMGRWRALIGYFKDYHKRPAYMK